MAPGNAITQCLCFWGEHDSKDGHGPIVSLCSHTKATRTHILQHTAFLSRPHSSTPWACRVVPLMKKLVVEARAVNAWFVNTSVKGSLNPALEKVSIHLCVRMHRYDAACKHLSANAMMDDQYQHLLLHTASMTMLHRRKGRSVGRAFFTMSSLATFSLHFLLFRFDCQQILARSKTAKRIGRRWMTSKTRERRELGLGQLCRSSSPLMGGRKVQLMRERISQLNQRWPIM